MDYYRTPQWQAIKQAAIEAASGTCEFCGSPAETAHHVKYPRKLGTEDPTTLIAICWKCHGLLHGRHKPMECDDDQLYPTMLENVKHSLCCILGTWAALNRSKGYRSREGEDGNPEYDDILESVGNLFAKTILDIFSSERIPSQLAVSDMLGCVDGLMVDLCAAEWHAEQAAKAN